MSDTISARYQYIKRAGDLVISSIVFIILFPLFILVSVLLSISNAGSPFFIHERPGKYGKLFKFLKFKTMNDKKDIYGNLLPDNQRITRIGRIVRKFSIDEIPQLLNVIKGDMSLVGPRPLLKEYLPLYNEFQKRRHNVKPGITGWAQVNGRNAISWDKKFEYDIWYVENISLKVDLKILYLTLWKTITFEGINQSQETTMSTFIGTD
jgi:undecaprenyl phosphate N,N'-diacetylbacillosamine 1-phosphate transferase